MDLKNKIVRRLGFVYSLMLIFGLGITLRILLLQNCSNEYKDEQLYDTTEVYPLRGNIFASEGELLSTTQTRYTVAIDPNVPALNKDTFERYVGALVDSLTAIFPDKKRDVLMANIRRIRERGLTYLEIQKGVSFDTCNRVKKFPLFNKGRYRGGRIIRAEDSRVLPYGDVATRIIGNVNRSSAIGIEGWYDTHLKGDQEKKVLQLIYNKRLVVDEEYDHYDVSAINAGKDVVSTINIRWQEYAHKILLEQVKAIHADTAAIILMEVKTGEVKVLANIIKSPKEERYYERSNFAVAGRMEPGSTFKLASMMVALKDGKFSLEDMVNTGYSGFKIISGARITEAGGHGYGKLSVRQVFEKSSNIGTALLIDNSYKNNKADFLSGLDNLNLNYKTDIDLHGEAEPRIKPLSEWEPGTLPNMATGYQVELTPLQILTFYNAVANNGVFVKPRLVKEIKHYGKTVEKFYPEKRRNISDIKTIRKVKQILEGVVNRGTAKSIKSNQYKIAGKTGTAQVAYSDGEGYHRGTDSSAMHYGSFAGYFPADNPKYSCFVVLKTKSKTRFYGGDIAAPLFRKLADKVYSTSPKFRRKITKRTKNRDIPYSKVGYKNDLNTVYAGLRVPVKGRLKSKSNLIYTAERKGFVEYKDRRIKKGQVPKLVGMGLKDAIFIAESLGLKVKVRGRGTVRQQSLKAGEKLGRKRTITLTLN